MMTPVVRMTRPGNQWCLVACSSVEPTCQMVMSVPRSSGGWGVSVSAWCTSRFRIDRSEPGFRCWPLLVVSVVSAGKPSFSTRKALSSPSFVFLCMGTHSSSPHHGSFSLTSTLSPSGSSGSCLRASGRSRIFLKMVSSSRRSSRSRNSRASSWDGRTKWVSLGMARLTMWPVASRRSDSTSVNSSSINCLSSMVLLCCTGLPSHSRYRLMMPVPGRANAPKILTKESTALIE
mmetsp:Transcript_113980/g.322685  ORF Transcript_113980/g.322685 Transcript_113980/m.322685 type:complete len:233 (-) Transcript_113980:721-1419(-)